MPLYTYACPTHGDFSAWAIMERSESRQPCPACAAPAQRALAKPAIGRPARAASAGFQCEAAPTSKAAGMGCACMGGGCRH